MPQTIARLKHRIKVLVGAQLSKLLSRQYARGQGPARRLTSGFSTEAQKIGVEHKIFLPPRPVRKLTPQYSLHGHIEDEYRNLFLSGEDFTNNAGILTAREVDVSFPIGMHQVGGHILREAVPAPYLLTNPKYYYDFAALRFKRKRPMNQGVLLSMPWHHNFYHWMIEFLPRLIAYDRCPELQQVPIIAPKSAARFVAESLKHAGYLPKTIFLEDGAYRFKKLHMLSMLMRTNEVSPDAIDWLNAKFTVTPSILDRPRRIYVSRRDAKIRFVSNELELSDVLSEFGFEIFVSSGVPLVDQINIFRSAECIIGPHGAAFANLAFSMPGATVIEFFCKGHFSACFNRVSAIRGLNYGFLVGEPSALGGFTINPSHLREVLSQALQPSSRPRIATAS